MTRELTLANSSMTDDEIVAMRRELVVAHHDAPSTMVQRYYELRIIEVDHALAIRNSRAQQRMDASGEALVQQRIADACARVADQAARELQEVEDLVVKRIVTWLRRARWMVAASHIEAGEWKVGS